MTIILSKSSYPLGDWALLVLSKIIETYALVTPAWPNLYTNSYKVLTLALNMKKYL